LYKRSKSCIVGLVKPSELTIIASFFVAFASGAVFVACASGVDSGSTLGTGGGVTLTTSSSGSLSSTSGNGAGTGNGGQSASSSTSSGAGAGTASSTSSTGGGTGGSTAADNCTPTCNIDADCQNTCNAAPSGSIWCCDNAMCYQNSSSTCPASGSSTSSGNTGT
jgi:hypothetical protein